MVNNPGQLSKPHHPSFQLFLAGGGDAYGDAAVRVLVDGLVFTPNPVADVIGGLGCDIDLDPLWRMPVQSETPRLGIGGVETEVFPGGGDVIDPMHGECGGALLEQ